MKRRVWVQGMAAMSIPFGVAGAEQVVLTITLDQNDPSRSKGVFRSGESFPVGFGQDGYLPSGSSFQGGASLLGEFQVNAILTHTDFQMVDSLVEKSGKSQDWLAKNLFANMSSIDFDGDGKGGEYGDAFISLEPVRSDAKQPFHFGEYNGVFRWYSYAIHGTQDEARIGKCITGGCINVGKDDLTTLISTVTLGDFVRILGSP